MQSIHLVRQLIAVTACAWGLAAGSSSIALADDAPPAAATPDHTERFKDMTPEQREAKRRQMREEWSKLSPEEKEKRRAAMRERMHERMEKMSPEQREEMKKRMRERMEKMTPEEKERFMKERRERREEHDHDDAPAAPAAK